MEAVRKRRKILLLLLPALFFTAAFLLGEHHFSEDWYSYYSLSIIREPGYALFVRGALGLFGQEGGIHFIAFIQNLLAAFAIWRCGLVASKLPLSGRKESASEGGILSGMIAVLLLLLPHIATPLASNTHLILTDTVMAEGVCLSLFYLYMIPMTGLVFFPENKGKNGLKAFLLALLMCQFRGQMMTCFILTALVLLVRCFSKKKEVVLSLAGMVLFFGLNTLIGGTYQYVVNGYFSGKTLGPANMACNMLYLSGEEAAERMKNVELKELFIRMRELALEKELHISFAPKGVIEGEAHYSACHDRINYEIFEPLTQEYLSENGTDISDYALYRIKADEVGLGLFKELLIPEFGEWLSLYLKVCAVGFIRTVAIVHPLFNWYTVLVYGLAAFLVCLGLLRLRGEGEWPVRQTGYLLMVLVSIAGTVCSTALIIECWARYVFYNMPFFYFGLYIVLRGLWDIRKYK